MMTNSFPCVLLNVTLVFWQATRNTPYVWSQEFTVSPGNI